MKINTLDIFLGRFEKISLRLHEIDEISGQDHHGHKNLKVVARQSQEAHGLMGPVAMVLTGPRDRLSGRMLYKFGGC